MIARNYKGRLANANRPLPLPLRLNFYLTHLYRIRKLLTMDKQEIKDKLLQAVKSDPHFDDIKSVAIFGSYVNGTPTETSDVDVLIDFLPSATIGYFELAQIKRNFEKFLGRVVDLLTPPAISKYFRAEVLQQADCFYEK